MDMQVLSGVLDVVNTVSIGDLVNTVSIGDFHTMAAPSTGIPKLDAIMTKLENHEGKVLALLPTAAVIYSVFHGLGWFTMTEDEQNQVKKKWRTAALVALCLDILVWFIMNL